jgi:hypothetical protein
METIILKGLYFPIIENRHPRKGNSKLTAFIVLQTSILKFSKTTILIWLITEGEVNELLCYLKKFQLTGLTFFYNASHAKRGVWNYESLGHKTWGQHHAITLLDLPLKSKKNLAKLYLIFKKKNSLQIKW